MALALAYLSGEEGARLAGFVTPVVPLVSVLLAMRRPGVPRGPLGWLAGALLLLWVRNIARRVGVEDGWGLSAVNVGALVALFIVTLSLISLAWWRSGRSGRAWNFDAALDSSLIVSGGIACILCLVTLPALARQDITALDTLAVTVIPIMDMAVVAAVTYLVFITPTRLPARWLLLASVLLLFLFDMARAAAIQQGLTTTPRPANALLALAYGVLGAWALHPTMPGMVTSELQLDALAWSPGRVAVLALGLAAPIVLIAFTPSMATRYVVVLVVANLLSTALILIRSVRAVRAFARAQSALRVQAERDGLTGLANRPAFRAHVGEMLALADHTGRTVSVVYVDLNGFKTVNDTLGHAAGDELLVEVGRRMRYGLRADDFPTRLGGDEFALVCLDDQAGSVGDRLARRIQALFDAPFPVGGKELPVRAAVGWANTTDLDASSSDALVGAADRAMYAAKRAGATTPHRVITPDVPDGNRGSSVPTPSPS